MADYDNHQEVVGLLEKAQEVEHDCREVVREVDAFLNHPQGQWEEKVWNSHANRPRYTLDRCNDIVDDVAGEMEQADFDIRVKPAGGDATKDLAKTYDGLIRNIENLSNAVDVFNASGRKMVAAGFDAWRVSQRWGDNNSFDQDLFIDPIADAVNRVWFDFNSTLQTREDAEWAFVLQSMSKVVYEEKFPEGSGISIDSDSTDSSDRTPEIVTVGEFLFKTRVKREIVLMSNGSVYVNDDKFKTVIDELQAQGIRIERRRNREMIEVKTRIFDGKDWLTDVQSTVFDYIPIIPTYGNFSVTQSVPTFWGLITKKMDAQRIYNYSESRKVEEGALAPVEKIIATPEQVGANQAAWENLNTSSDPALLYTHVDGQPQPYKIGGSQANAGLEMVSQSALQNLQSTAGLDQMNGQALGLQSGLAVELKQNKGDTRNYKYTVSQRRAIAHTAKILVSAIPKVYDTKRQVRILNEDDSFDMVTLNDEILDEETGQPVKLHDLSQGIYDVVCEPGPAFKNRQSETAEGFAEMAAIDPSIIHEGKDIWYGSLNSPGFDQLAVRARRNMVLAGSIPDEQMTDEEKELIANMPDPEPDPVAEALQREADNNDAKIELQGIELVRKEKETDAKIASTSMETAFKQMKTLTDELTAQVNSLKALRESGASPELIVKQAAIVSDSQAEQV